MYDKDRIAERLEAAKEQLGWEPTYHTVEEVDQVKRALDRIANFSDEGKFIDLKRPFTEREQMWIRNERMLCACDAAYFCTRYAYLKTDDNSIRRFAFRDAQKVYFKVISELERRQAAIQILALKARQLGISSLTEILVAHRIFFTYGVNAVIASAAQQQTQIMSNMIFIVYDNLPYWMQPPWTRRVESDKGMLVFGGIQSGVSFQHGAQASGIARGTTPTVVHLCVAGKTPIKMASGTTALMRETKTGDRVIAQDGTAATVVRAWRSPRSGEVTSEIMLWGEPSPLAVTRDHKVLTKIGWIEAKDVDADDKLFVPCRPISKTANFVDVKDIPKYGKTVQRRDPYWKPVPVNFSLGKLIGLYLAEGCVSRSSKKKTAVGLLYACHEKEAELFNSYIEDVFGPTGRAIMRRKTSKTCVLCLNRGGFAEWVLHNFGEKDGKRLNPMCWELGEEFARGVLLGYLEGDGHYAVRDNTIYASSIRASLAYGMRDLAASLGYGWGSISYREAGNYYNRNCKSIWIWNTSGTTATAIRRDAGEEVHESSRPDAIHWEWNEEKTGIWVSVSSNNDGFSEDFYDLEVDHKDHSFCTAQALVHNSECATFQNPEDLIEASLFRAVHESPNVLMILESTAEGVDNWWHKTWKASKSGWSKGRSRLCPMFLPWFLGTELYPKPTWMRTRPIPEVWKPSRETRQMMSKAKMYVNSDPLLSEVLGECWEMGKAQAWFWEVNYEEYKSKGREKMWLQEMPGDDIECFQSSFDSVFGNDLLTELHENREKKFKIYAISGQGIEDKFQPYDEDIDWDQQRRVVKYESQREETYTWTLIPLLDSSIQVPDDPMDPDMENAMEQADGKLLIFHEPRPGLDYTIGVDSGQGVGGDSTVISVWGKGKGGGPDIQVAEFSSNLVSHIEAYAFVMAIASLYMKFMDHPREPLVSIEVLAAVGDMVQLQMGKMGYSRFHQFVRYDTKKISKRKAHKRGWFTTSWSRPLLVDGFTHSVKNGWVEIHSPFLLAEMKNFEVHMTQGGREKLEHADGSHDDRVFASAIAVFTSHDLDAMIDRGKKRYIPANETTRPPIDVDSYNAGSFLGDEKSGKQTMTTRDLEEMMAGERFSY